MTAWEKFFDEKIRLVAQGKEILDVGGAGGFIKLLAPYEHLFKDSRYRSLDISAEAHPDIVGDIHNLPVPENSLDGVICICVLEHVENPKKAMDEIQRVLKPGGQCLLYAPFLHPYHAREGVYNYKDYYRYSRDGLSHLARNFSKVEMSPVRLFFETWFYLLPNPLGKIFMPLGRFLDFIVRPKGNQTSGFYLYLVK